LGEPKLKFSSPTSAPQTMRVSRGETIMKRAHLPVDHADCYDGAPSHRACWTPDVRLFIVGSAT
jgi:hypothetical protein